MNSIAKILMLLYVMLAFSSLALADTVQIGSGSATFSYLPIYTNNSYNYTQQIYTQPQINRSGEISAISFFYTNGDISNSKNWKIYLGHCARSSFSDTADWEPLSNLTLVYDGDVSPYLPQGNNWMNIPLSAHFNYNNTNNLILAVYENTPNYGNTIGWRSFSSDTNSAIYYHSNSTIPNPQNPPTANAITSSLAQIQLVFPNTSVPLAPTLLYPGNGESVFSDVQLYWQSTMGGGAATSYDLYLGTDPNPPLLASDLSRTSYAPQLQGDTTYYWKVVANNAVGSSPASAIWSFTTMPEGSIQVGNGTTSNFRPFSTQYGYERSAALYTQDQIGSFGVVSRLSWSVAATGTANVPYKIWIKNVTNNNLTSQSWSNLMDGATLVKEGNHTFNSSGWHTFVLDTPFVYLSGNLLIGVQSDTEGSGIAGYPYIHYTGGNASKHQIWYRDENPPTTVGILNANRPNIIIHYADLGDEPDFLISASNHDFGEVRLGTSATQDFTITNVGGGDLIISDITISGSPGFSLTNLPTLPATIVSVANTSFGVEFSPTQTGPASATVTITDNIGRRSTHTVQLTASGTGIHIIGNGSTNLMLPVHPFYGYTYSQSIYLQSEINTQGQRIEKIAYYWNGAAAGNLSNGWTIYMGHTDLNVFRNTSDWLSLDELTPVFMGQPNIPAIAGWIEVILDIPFIYNNSQNLVIAVDENTAGIDGSAQFFHSTTTATNARSLRYYSDTINPDPAAPPEGTLINGYPNLKFTFNPIPAGAVFSINPAAYDFGNVKVDNIKNKSFRITNLGSSDLGINSITISGNAGFSLSTLPTTLPLTLEMAESALFNVEFAPTEIGNASATISIVDNIGNRTFHTVQVTGYGVEFQTIGEGTSNTYRPFCTLYGYERSAALYTQDQIGTYGLITRLAWNVATTGTTSVPYKIWIKSVSNETMITQSWDSLIDGAILAKEGNHLFNSTGWHEFILDIPFLYTAGNLLIGVQSDVGGSGTGGYPYIHYTTAIANQHQTWSQDGSPSTGSGNVSANLPDLRIYISPPSGDPAFMVNPSSYNFGDVRIGTSKSRNFTITNVGGGDLVVNSISISGNAAFTLSNLPTLPATLETVQNASFTVDYSPTALGTASATITITDNIGNRTEHEIEVTGNGTQFMIIGEGTSNLYLPVNAYYGYTYSQSIYLQSEINLENQRIERLAYYWNGAGVGNLSNGWTIYMGHTSQSIFTSTSGWIPLNQLTPVYIGQPDIPATPGWIEVMLTIPFIYNNTDNLIIAVHENTPSYNGSAQFFYSTPTSSNRSLRYYSDSVNPDPTSPPAGTVVTGFPNIKLTMGDVPTTPVFQILPAGDYNFGDVNIGGSKSKTFTVSNYGIGSLGITNISITGSSAMSLGTIPDLPVYLQIAQSLEVEVTYSPSLLGQDTATLSFTDDLNNRYVLGENSVLTLANAGCTSRDTHTITLTGTGVNDITLGDGSQNARMPMDFYYRSSLYETVFTQDELNNFLGLITGLKLYNGFNSNLNNKPVKIWLGSTTQANLENGFIPADQLELVYDGPMDFPSGENTISFTFPEPYLHLDGGNLVMMIRRPMDTSYHSSSDQFKCQTGNTNRARNLYSDSIDYDENNPGAGTATGIYPRITFTVIPGGVGHINGTVLGPDGDPLPGVTVTLDGRPISIQTDQQGYFSIPNQLPNNYSLTFTKHTYVTQVINFELEEDETEVVDITMQFMPRVSVSGTILASDTGEGIAGANIRFTGYETFMGSSTANGSFTMPNVFANQTYNYLISAAGYVSTTGELNLGAANHNMGEITLAEVAYAPNTVIADLNATYDTVNLSWSAPDPNAVEITESFEDAEFPPAGWSQVITNTGPANTLGVYPTWCSFGATNTGTGLVEPTEGSKQAGLWWVTEHQDEWLKTPSFNCPPDAYMVFDTYATYGSPNGDHYYVKISNTGGNTWTALWDASVLPEGANNYQNPITIDLANYAGSEVILAFHADDPPSNDGLWHVWFIDNIYIGNMVQTISFNGSDLIPGRISINSSLGSNASPNTELSRAPQLRYAESGLSSIAKPHKAYTRALVGYKVWRLLAGQENNEATWISLTDETISTLNYADADWPNLSNGTYKWAAKAIYTADVISAPAFSNSLVKEQLNGMVVGFVRRSNNQGIPGAVITASNGTTATTNNAGAYSMLLPVGVFSLTANANGYQPLTQDDITIAPNQNTTLNFVLIPMSNEDEVAPITATALKGNYPNPFNPETTISYDLKDAAQVRLEIYNLKGQLVRSLVNKAQAAGRYRIVFDGKDDKKLPLSSGVYLYRFSAGDYRKTQKMMLMQ